MNLSYVEQLQKVLQQQFERLAASDVATVQRLENEKTVLLEQLFADQLAPLDPKLQSMLKDCAEQQQELERLCTSVRDELGQALSLQLRKDKALETYKALDKGF